MLIHHGGYSNCQNPNKWSELQVMPYLLNERLVAKSTNKKLRKHRLRSIGTLGSTFRQMA